MRVNSSTDVVTRFVLWMHGLFFQYGEHIQLEAQFVQHAVEVRVTIKTMMRMF